MVVSSDQEKGLKSYPYRYRKFHTNLLRHFHEGIQVLRRTWIHTGTSNITDYVPHDVDQAILIIPNDEDKGLIWGTPVDMYAQRTLNLGAIEPHLVPRFNMFVDALKDSVSKSRARGAKPAHLAHGGPILNDEPGAIRLAERAFRWGDKEMNMMVLLKQTRVVPFVKLARTEKQRAQVTSTILSC